MPPDADLIWILTGLLGLLTVASVIGFSLARR